MYIYIPFLGSLYVQRLSAAFANRPCFVERVDPGDGGREYNLVARRWDILLASAGAHRAELRRAQLQIGESCAKEIQCRCST